MQNSRATSRRWLGVSWARGLLSLPFTARVNVHQSKDSRGVCSCHHPPASVAFSGSFPVSLVDIFQVTLPWRLQRPTIKHKEVPSCLCSFLHLNASIGVSAIIFFLYFFVAYEKPFRDGAQDPPIISTHQAISYLSPSRSFLSGFRAQHPTHQLVHYLYQLPFRK